MGLAHVTPRLTWWVAIWCDLDRMFPLGWSRGGTPSRKPRWCAGCATPGSLVAAWGAK